MRGPASPVEGDDYSADDEVEEVDSQLSRDTAELSIRGGEPHHLGSVTGLLTPQSRGENERIDDFELTADFEGQSPATLAQEQAFLIHLAGVETNSWAFGPLLQLVFVPDAVLGNEAIRALALLRDHWPGEGVLGFNDTITTIRLSLQEAGVYDIMREYLAMDTDAGRRAHIPARLQELLLGERPLANVDRAQALREYPQLQALLAADHDDAGFVVALAGAAGRILHAVTAVRALPIQQGGDVEGGSIPSLDTATTSPEAHELDTVEQMVDLIMRLELHPPLDRDLLLRTIGSFRTVNPSTLLNSDVPYADTVMQHTRDQLVNGTLAVVGTDPAAGFRVGQALPGVVLTTWSRISDVWMTSVADNVTAATENFLEHPFTRVAGNVEYQAMTYQVAQTQLGMAFNLSGFTGLPSGELPNARVMDVVPGHTDLVETTDAVSGQLVPPAGLPQLYTDQYPIHMLPNLTRATHLLIIGHGGCFLRTVQRDRTIHLTPFPEELLRRCGTTTAQLSVTGAVRGGLHNFGLFFVNHGERILWITVSPCNLCSNVEGTRASAAISYAAGLNVIRRFGGLPLLAGENLFGNFMRGGSQAAGLAIHRTLLLQSLGNWLHPSVVGGLAGSTTTGIIRAEAAEFHRQGVLNMSTPGVTRQHMALYNGSVAGGLAGRTTTGNINFGRVTGDNVLTVAYTCACGKKHPIGHQVSTIYTSNKVEPNYYLTCSSCRIRRSVPQHYVTGLSLVGQIRQGTVVVGEEVLGVEFTCICGLTYPVGHAVSTHVNSGRTRHTIKCGCRGARVPVPVRNVRGGHRGTQVQPPLCGVPRPRGMVSAESPQIPDEQSTEHNEGKGGKKPDATKVTPITSAGIQLDVDTLQVECEADAKRLGLNRRGISINILLLYERTSAALSRIPGILVAPTSSNRVGDPDFVDDTTPIRSAVSGLMREGFNEDQAVLELAHQWRRYVAEVSLSTTSTSQPERAEPVSEEQALLVQYSQDMQMITNFVGQELRGDVVDFQGIVGNALSTLLHAHSIPSASGHFIPDFMNGMANPMAAAIAWLVNEGFAKCDVINVLNDLWWKTNGRMMQSFTAGMDDTADSEATVNASSSSSADGYGYSKQRAIEVTTPSPPPSRQMVDEINVQRTAAEIKKGMEDSTRKAEEMQKQLRSRPWRSVRDQNPARYAGEEARDKESVASAGGIDSAEGSDDESASAGGGDSAEDSDDESYASDDL